uniref:J domain-containing protein n=3 Tax=Auxenochlorella protothecoides TaxID=3075 RepID=A0A1D2A6S0_AUXPR
MMGLWASYDRLLVRLSRQTWVRAATEWLEGHQSVASIGIAVAHTLLVVALAGPLPSCLLALTCQTLLLLFLPYNSYLAASLGTALTSRLVTVSGLQLARFLVLRMLWTPAWWTHLPPVLGLLAYARKAPPETQLRTARLAAVPLLLWAARGGAWGAVTAAAFLTQCSHAGERTGAATAGALLALRFVSWAVPLALFAALSLAVIPLTLLWRFAARRLRRPGGTRPGPGPGAPDPGAPAPHALPAHLPALAVPPSTPPAVVAVLRSGNYYEVLQLPRGAGEADVRRAKRAAALTTHPDKAGGGEAAEAAFRLVAEAADTLLDPARRRDYDAELELLASPGLADDLAAAAGFADAADMAAAAAAGARLQACAACGGAHVLRPLEPARSPAAARRCDECGRGAAHAVREGEVWLERRYNRWSPDTLCMLCCLEGRVWDMSESAHCEGLFEADLLRDFPFNAHDNPFARLGRGSSASAKPRAGKRGGRARKKGSGK